MNGTGVKDFRGLELGLGLIGIGRPWPGSDSPVSTADQTRTLLDRAHALGIRFFDTAAAYGASEQRLGDWLTTLPRSERDRLLIATKCGEEWSPQEGGRTDHSLDAVRRSFDTSIERLERIDLLQLHKCTAADFADDALIGWFAALKASMQVTALGASVSTPDALRLALDTQVFDTVQFPANTGNTVLAEAYEYARGTVLPCSTGPWPRAPSPAARTRSRTTSRIFGVLWF